MTVETADLTVVIACHTDKRWASIVAAVESARAQEMRPAVIVVAVDHNPSLAERLTESFADVRVVLNDSIDHGASATRNAGAAVATTSLTAFLDDDETAEPDWLSKLVAPFADRHVVGTGGRYRPNWLVGKPFWFPDEFAWVVGGSFTGMPTQTSQVRNVWSGNMAVRTSAFRAVGGFRSGFGKVNGQSRPEDTDLCIRMAADSGGHWVYVPEAVIDHEVPAGRSTFNFFVRRTFAEGRGKIEMKRQLEQANSLGDESSYLRRTLPKGVVLHLRNGGPGICRALSIAVGVISAGVGAIAAVANRPPKTARRDSATTLHARETAAPRTLTPASNVSAPSSEEPAA